MGKSMEFYSRLGLSKAGGDDVDPAVPIYLQLGIGYRF